MQADMPTFLASGTTGRSGDGSRFALSSYVLL
jgi:hypothetical protein